MKISRQLLDRAIKENILSKEEVHRLIDFINQTSQQEVRFNLSNVLYYLGGLIAIGAMTLFMNLGWELYGGYGILFLSLAYAILCLALTHKLDQKGYIIPAGVMATFVICLSPLGIYGFQLAMGWWPQVSAYPNLHSSIQWNLIFMELGTLLVGLTLVRIYRYPFMLMPIAITLWYLSLDISHLFYAQSSNVSIPALNSIGFGLLMIFIAFYLDIKSRHLADYAFWLYFIGAMVFWLGLSYHQPNSELGRFLYCLANLMMMLIGVILNRKVFVVFGVFGLCIYLSYLSFQVFRYSYLFPVALSLIGFCIIYLGLLWQKNEIKLSKAMRSMLPKSIQDLLSQL